MLNKHRSPPIQYLPAFVAAARHNSFKLAAAQLNITPSAVSQQIKTLESYIGLPLFSRQKRELQLTQAGNSFFQVAEVTLAHYESGCLRFFEHYLSPTLKVSMIPYIANELIIPKLADFQEQHPDINLVVQTSMQLENLQNSELDAAIRFGTPPWPEHNAELISPAQSCLVAHPDYWSKHPISEREDWQNQTLIHSRSNTNDWQRLMDSIQNQFSPKRELYFDSYDAGIRAAEAGLGIAIGILPIIKNKIAQGKLTALSERYVSIEEGFYLVTKPNDSKQEAYRQLALWLKKLFIYTNPDNSL